MHARSHQILSSRISSMTLTIVNLYGNFNWYARYAATLSKWVQSATNPYTATLLEWLHPMRVSRHMFGSSFNPAMPIIASVASTIRNDRHAVPDDAPLKKAEATMFDAVRETLTQARVTRDNAMEQVFDRIYGSGDAPADQSHS